MSDEKTYNGWTNKFTWAVNLWFGGDEGLYALQKELIAQRPRKSNGNDAEWEFAEMIRDAVRELVLEPLPASLTSDLLGTALGQVNWGEIAKSWLEDVE